MFKSLVLLFFVPIIFAACKQQIDLDNLYGKWKYIRVEHNNEPTDTTQAGELASEKPYIEFTRDNKLQIVWGGRAISTGKFSIDGYNIRYKETLSDGTVREFPFWVSKIDSHQIIFNTKGADGTKVTAIKE
jgi:hypothetical protein